MKKHLHGDDKAKLSIAEEATAGIIGEMKQGSHKFLQIYFIS